MKLLDNIARRFGYVPARKPSLRGYNAANTGRLWQDWTTSITSNDAMLRTGLRTMRARSRDLVRNDDYARKFVSLSTVNVIGPSGITLQMDVTDDNGRPDDAANDLIEMAWDKFSRKDSFTVTGEFNRIEAEQMVWKTLIRDGEVLLRKVRGWDNPFRFSLQLIETDYLDDEKNEILANGNFIRMGVEYDGTWRRPVAYWLRTKHPGDDYSVRATRTDKHVRVPADEVMHRYLRDFIEQARGVPWFHTAMNRLKMLGGFEEAALVAARIGASKMGFYVSKPDANGNYVGDDSDADGNPVQEVEPGVFEKLPTGYDVTTFDPSYPHTEHTQFVKAILRGIASGMLVSYNSLANDLEGVNYSSIRAGVLEDRDCYRTMQEWFISQIERDIFEEWLRLSLLAGAIKTPSGKVLPATKFDKFNSPKFSGRRWAWVDPLKDIEANILAIQHGITPRSQIVADNGGDLADNYRQFVKDKELQKANGLDFDTVAAAKTKAGRPPEEEPATSK